MRMCVREVSPCLNESRPFARLKSRYFPPDGLDFWARNGPPVICDGLAILVNVDTCLSARDGRWRCRIVRARAHQPRIFAGIPSNQEHPRSTPHGKSRDAEEHLMRAAGNRPVRILTVKR